MKKYELAQLKHKANNWDVLLKWAIVPGIVLVVMILCGCIETYQP